MTPPRTASRPETPRARGVMIGATFLAVILSAAAALLGFPGAAAAHPAAAARTATGPLTLTVTGSSPAVPQPSTKSRSLKFTVRIDNTSDQNVKDVSLRADRNGNAIATQAALDSSRRDNTLPSGLYPVSPRPATQPTVDVPAGAYRYATFTTTTSTLDGAAGLCLCANGVYAIYLSAYDTSSGKTYGFTKTYVAARDATLTKVGVSWVWPLIDRPHRLTEGRVFTDDDLTGSVEPGGRLDRALQVVEAVEAPGHAVPLTVVVDPELVDELYVMANGGYSVRQASGRTTPGTGGVQARDWLARLVQVIQLPDVTVQLTPYADPDVQSLTSNGLDWQPTMPATMAARVQRALGGIGLATTMAWPPSNAISQDTLDTLADDGITTALLNGTSVTPSTVDGLPASVARLRTGSGPVIAALTSPAMQDDVAATIGDSSTGPPKLPELLAELAVRADTTPYAARVAFLTPPRYVDPDPSVAANVIRASTSGAFTTPISFQSAVTGAFVPDQRSRLRPVSRSASALPFSIVSRAQQLVPDLHSLRSLLTGPGQAAAALALVNQFPHAVQRIESASWRSSAAPVGGPAVGLDLANQLRQQVTSILSGVHIVLPASGRYNYTLASSDSPVPITVQNTTPYRAFVRVQVAVAGGRPGLTASDIGVKSVAGGSKQTFKVPTQIQRSGRIQASATLSTPDDSYTLGRPVGLSVHSTVFGTIGVVITVAASVVLVLALALRYYRRIQRLRSKRRAEDARQSRRAAQPEPAS